MHAERTAHKLLEGGVEPASASAQEVQSPPSHRPRDGLLFPVLVVARPVLPWPLAFLVSQCVAVG